MGVLLALLLLALVLLALVLLVCALACDGLARCWDAVATTGEGVCALRAG